MTRRILHGVLICVLLGWATGVIYGWGQPPQPVSVLAFKVGDSISISDELKTSTSTTLKINGASLSAAPSVVDNSLKASQSLEIIAISGDDVTVGTKGVEINDIALGTADPIYSVVCGTANRFLDAHIVPTDTVNAFLTVTCDNLSRVEGAAKFRDSLNGAAAVMADASGIQVLLPVSYSPPVGTWSLEVTAPGGNPSSFGVTVKSADNTKPDWNGNLVTTLAGDDVSLTLHCDVTTKDAAPSGESMDVEIRTTVTTHRTFSIHPIQAPQQGGGGIL